MTTLKEMLANENIIQKVRQLNFEKEVQVKDEIDELEAKKDELGARKDEELEYIILRNNYLGRLVRDTEEKKINETDEIKKREERRRMN